MVYFDTQIDHFTNVCSVTWPLNGSEAGVDLALIDLSDFVMQMHLWLALKQLDLHKGQVSEQTTVKWSKKHRKAATLLSEIEAYVELSWEKLIKGSLYQLIDQ